MGPRTIIAALLGGLAATAQANPVQVCPGTYEGRWGQVTLDAQGLTTLAGTPGTSVVTLTALDCDRLMMHAEGQSMTLTRKGPDHFQGRLDGGGAARDFDFHFATPAHAIGVMQAQGGELTGRRGMELRLVSASGAVDPACFGAEPVIGALSREAVAAALWAQAQGLSPAPGRDIQDYISAVNSHDPVRDVVSHRISFDLGLGGEVLPSAGAQERTAAYCDPGLFLDPPRRLLNFKLFAIAPGVTVFGQIIDVETGRIMAQTEGRADGTDAEALARAMAQASAGLALRIGPMSDGFTRR